MIVLYIILAVLVLLFASLVLPIRLSLRLVNDNFTLSLKILGIRYRLYPAKRRTKPSKERKQKKAGQQPATEQGSVAGELRDLLGAAIPRIPKVFGAISVPKFRLRLRIAAEDPAKCAELFGAVCAAFGLFWHQLDRVFTFHRPRIDIEPDFDYNVLPANQ